MSALAHRCLLLYGLTLFVFEDCRGLFLRHTQTGKCIAASDELVYNNKRHALPYYVVMTDNCLDKKAEFRYLDNQLLHNIVKDGTLVSPPNESYKSRWAVYKGVATDARRYQQSAEHRLKPTAVGSLFFYNRNNPVCAEPDSSNYVLRKTSCGTTKQEFTFGAVTAYNAKMKNVHCSPIQCMLVTSADYGSFDDSGTFNKNATIETKCSKLTNCQVKSRCDGKESCELTIDNILLPSQYCSDTSKQIYTKYTCVDEKSNIITEANIGLQEVYKGCLKVNDDSTWRSVVNTKWDKNQEKILCQHLGFKSTEEPVRFQTIENGINIASGDLICYITNASRISCCVHLNPSTAKGQERSPYVECKLCDTPILTARKKFSNEIFSGHGGSDYRKANFSENGWCSSMSDSYLLLDLQNEYHLTHIVVMANKDQTKWSSSYSMQYSHSNTSIDSTGETQIKGNDNGYQASITELKAVYNARYIKIKSNGSTDFCMRVEVCGTVQTPAPVYDITITPSVTWANVTWKLQTSAADSSYITHLIIHVEGKENSTIVKRGNQFNITGLKRYTKYSVGIQTQDGSSQKSKKIFETFTTLKEDGNSGKNEEKQDSGNVGIAVGASLGVIVIIIFLILAVIFLRRRYKEGGKNLKEKSQQTKTLQNSIDEEGVDEDFVANEEVANDLSLDEAANEEVVYTNEIGGVDETAHPPVPILEFAHYVHELKAKKNSEFQKQYKDLPKNMKTSWEVAKKPFNKKKNRYGNIVTYDYCRVVLSGGENEDYINASYIDGINENSYIACQGPTILTLHDMWRMVWEQRSYSIVMVTSLVELSKVKCEKYWPDSGTEKYGDVEVTLMKIEEFADHVTHTLQLKKDGEEREVRHYYFQSWPDHGVPKYPTQLLAFRRHFRIHHLEHSGPIIVHCSAGVGRTGVFLAIDTILDKLEKGVINSIDVFGEVCAMRERRMNMVQTLEQYMFIHEAILENILCGMNEVDSTKVRKEIESLSKVKTSGMTGFEEKFKRLGEVSPKLSPDECTAALLKSNAKKNRKKEIHPAESNRVPLQYVDGEENSDYINAVFVHGYLGRNYFIATQSPLPNTINDFWRLVHSQKSSTIVLLNAIKDGTSFPRFWPTTKGKPTQYKSLTVQLESEKESDGISIRKFMLSPYPDLSNGEVVNIFHYTKWPDHHIPSNVDAVITLTSLVENSRKNYGQGPIIVACSDGAGRTGTYIAISNLLERMKIEQAMDVFQSIKIIRARRPQFVENAEQYEFCYTAIMAYLDGFSEYSNFD